MVGFALPRSHSTIQKRLTGGSILEYTSILFDFFPKSIGIAVLRFYLGRYWFTILEYNDSYLKN
jgi:hypothetical protein